jgi:hypothetical protein
LSRRPSRRRASTATRKLTLNLHRLEVRELLSGAAGWVASPSFEAAAIPAGSTSPPTGAFSPAQIRQAYGFTQVSYGSVAADGTGQTIAIVDAYDDPNIQSDLNTFDAQYGLPAATVTRVDQAGGTTYPSEDSSYGWEVEESLDVEWAHAAAPGAKILLVEANTPSGNDLLTAVNYAAAHANVVSMSWGGGEYSGITLDDGNFSHAGVAFVASSGDSGAPIEWPASSPNVLAVGGTALSVNSSGGWSSEAGWSGSGGGPSAYETRPSYQSGVVTSTTMRANPDVAYDAAPATGFAVYDTLGGYDWMQVGGTSAGAPQWSALLAIADQGRALNGQAPLDSTSPQQVQSLLYANATSGIFHDITTGTSTGSPNYTAGPGYDDVTGLGSPLANLVIPALGGTAPVAPASDTLAVTTATNTDTAGTALSVTVTAEGAGGATDGGYLGTVHFSSTDTRAGLPANYKFTAADHGSHTFTVTLKTAGSQTVTAADTATSATRGTSAAITVSPAAARQMTLSGLPGSATLGARKTLTVTLRDAYGNLAAGYRGTVALASTDAMAVLPGSYTFTASDAGAHSFAVTFETTGTQTVTVSDSASGLGATSGHVSVTGAASSTLTDTVVSSGEIDLSWTGTAGATGYSLERTTGGKTGATWSVIATVPAGVTVYDNTGLNAGTTYSYRVRATAGSTNTAYSNIVTATTAASASAPAAGPAGGWSVLVFSPSPSSPAGQAAREAGAAPSVALASTWHPRGSVAQSFSASLSFWKGAGSFGL